LAVKAAAKAIGRDGKGVVFDGNAMPKMVIINKKYDFNVKNIKNNKIKLIILSLCDII